MAALIADARASIEQSRHDVAGARRNAVRIKRRNRVLTGVAMIAAALAVGVLSFYTGGGTMMIMYGLMVVGALRIAQGLHGSDDDQDSDWR